MSLDNFQTNYTSEDNASFNEIMEKSMEERRMKYRWVYDAETRRLTLDKPDSMLLEDGKMKVNPHGFIEEWKYIVIYVSIIISFDEYQSRPRIH